WTKTENTAFDHIRTRVTSAPILMFPDETRPFRVDADNSDFATDAILSQQSLEDDKWHPIAYYSKSLSAVERNYEIHDKEMLAVIRALEEWHHFLEGARHKFEIWTDHKNLEYFMLAKKLNRRQARWSRYLSRFDFAMHHRPGRSMGKSDALSRQADHGTGTGDNDNMTLLRPECFATRAIRATTGLSIEGEEWDILQKIREENRVGFQEDAVVKAVVELQKTRGKSVRTSEWSTRDGLLYFQDQVYVPKNLDLRRRITSQHHDTKIAGHAGRWKTLKLVSQNYWWLQMSHYIGKYVKTCDLCLQTKIPWRWPLGELHPLAIPESQKWEVISVDFIVELPDAHGYDAIMNVVDSMGKRAHFIPTHTTVTAFRAVQLFLQNDWKLHGLPWVIISDWGLQFVAEFSRELYRMLSIGLSTTTAYHPQSDGQ